MSPPPAGTMWTRIHDTSSGRISKYATVVAVQPFLQQGQPATPSRLRKSTLETGVGFRTTLTDTAIITPDGSFQGP